MTIIKLSRIAALIAFIAMLAGCAHPIAIQAEKTPERVEATLTQKKVAYAMTEVDRNKQVITPGGGGDRVSYYPYRDLEKGMREALRSIYLDVVVVTSATDTNAVRESGALLVFTPEIITISSSPSPFTWPPTQFTTEIVCKVTDASGLEISRIRVIGTGNAEFTEFKSNFGLAANRAGTDATAQLSKAIRTEPKLQ